MPHFYGTDKFVETSVIDDYATVRNALADAGIQVVFTGHFHTSDIAKAYNADLSKVIYDISTGSLISYPCDYREVMLSGDMATLSITTGHITELDGDLEFGNTAKNRLKTSVENIVASNGYSFIKTQAADAFIAHAEGNEHESSDAASTLSTLLSYAKVARILGIVPKATITDMEKMANSMLKDISAYGEEGRENQTEDLAVVLRVDADVRHLDRLFDRSQRRSVIRLDHKRSCFCDRNGRKLIDRSGNAVIIDSDFVQYRGIGSACSDTLEFIYKMVDAALHTLVVLL